MYYLKIQPEVNHLIDYQYTKYVPAVENIDEKNHSEEKLEAQPRACVAHLSFCFEET